MESKTEAFLRISALEWSDFLVAYAFYVMQDYLTDTWNLSFTHAASILNIWNGISMVLPFFFLFVIHTKLGHFMMLVLSSISYTAAIGLITLSTPPALANLTDTCKQYTWECIGYTQKVIFYAGMALLAVGVAGQSVSIKPLLIQQGNSPPPKSPSMNSVIRMIIISIVAVILFAHIKTWSLLFGIPAICSALALILFLSGWNTYTEVKPEGCSFTTVCRVFVAAARKKSLPYSVDPKSLYKKDSNESFTSTRFLRFLEKAAIKMLDDVGAEGEVNNGWNLCSVAEVEEAKRAARRMVSMWTTFIVFRIVSSIVNTNFVEQPSNMNRHLGKWNVPLPVLVLILTYLRLKCSLLCEQLTFGSVWENVIGMKSIILRALARLPVVTPIWFLAIIFPFFVPINFAVGALLVSFTVYIIPALVHMLTYRKASARKNAAEKPPFFIPNWNTFVVIWVLVVGFGFGGWASMTNFIKQIDTFGLFAKCYRSNTTTRNGSSTTPSLIHQS